MAYRLASSSGGRRLGETRSRPGTIGYDANPRGLAGASGNRGLAGTTNTASDIKRKKKEKEEDKKNKVALGENPPYEEHDYHDEVDANDIWLDALVPENYEPETVTIGEGVPGTDGEGWTLSLHIEEGAGDDGLFVITGRESAFFHITDASDKGSIKTPTSPLENGRVKHDHKVIEPKTLKINGMVARGDDTTAMKAVIARAEQSMSLKTYFILSSPWKNYPRMYLKAYSSKASSQKYDVFDYTIDLTELLIASDLKDTTDEPELASNTDKGTASGR